MLKTKDSIFFISLFFLLHLLLPIPSFLEPPEGFTVKKTTVYLAYDEPIGEKMQQKFCRSGGSPSQLIVNHPLHV